jgi:hypothetical protein
MDTQSIVILCLVIFILVVFIGWLLYKYFYRRKFIACCVAHNTNPEQIRKLWNQLQTAGMDQFIGIIDENEMEEKISEITKDVSYDTILNCGTLGIEANIFSSWV